MARALIAGLGVTAIVGSSGCFTARRPTAVNPEVPPSTAALPLPLPQTVPDAVPRAEPKSRYGNPPYYDVFGKRYYVLSSSADYVERGVASWYGPGFHQVLTSTREPYDMYGMTAAHRTLPLPAYVRVTNLQNGRSVVVRVNDRGPFVGNRIIDLSYTAAAKLDMLRDGTAMVEVRSLDFGPSPRDPNTRLTADATMAPQSGQTSAAAATSPSPVTAASPATAAPGTAPVPPNGATAASASAARTASTPIVASTYGAPALPPKPILFIQAGAFSDPANAERLAAKLRGGAYGRIFVRDDVIAGRKMYRVRIGPVADVAAFDRIYATLERDGVHDAHLALD